MKKVIISALIGALFGGAVVFATVQTPVSQQNQIVANAKGLPETVQQTPVVENQTIENKSVANSNDNYTCDPNEVLEKNKKFYQVYDSEYNEYTIFNIKKRTVSELEFELTYKNEKLNAPFVLKGVAKSMGCLGEYPPEGEPFSFIDTVSEENSFEPDGGYVNYTYESNDCYLGIGISDNQLLKVDNGKECKKLEEIGFKGFYIALNEYQ